MAKQVKARVRMKIPGGGATPAPPVGSTLGQHGVKLMDFCKAFNTATAQRKGETVPVIVTIYADRSFDFITKTPLTSELIKKKINLAKGSAKPGSEIVGSIGWSDIEEIAKIKLPDLNAVDLEGAKKIVAGSARSMGLNIIDKS